MARANANGMVLEYECSGPDEAAPLLMIHGVGAQLVRWPAGFCAALDAAGFRTIRYDSRDIGLSTRMDGAPVPDLRRSSSNAAVSGPAVTTSPRTVSS